jgi:hypothetical protein
VSSLDWKKVLGGVAPWLATALGGPAAGLATHALLDGLGLTGTVDASDPAAVEAAIGGAITKPDDLLKLRQIETSFQQAMQAAGFQHIQALEGIAAADRASARDREVKTQDWTPRVLAAVVVFGFLWAVFYVLSGRVQGLKDPATVGMVGTLIGYISAKADQVVGYYFGSSAGSDRKTEILGAK